MDKKRIIWLVIVILVLILCLSLATYAYYAGKEEYKGTFDIDVESKGVDVFNFNSTQYVSFMVDSTNFSEDNGHDVSGTGVIDMNLTTTKKETKYCYEVSFQMPNEQVFTYSDYNRPELVLDIYKRSSSNSDYVKVIDSLDITTMTGTIKVPTTLGGSDYKNIISTTKNEGKVESWKAVVTYKYFKDVYQGINDNKTYNSALKINVVDC